MNIYIKFLKNGRDSQCKVIFNIFEILGWKLDCQVSLRCFSRIFLIFLRTKIKHANFDLEKNWIALYDVHTNIQLLYILSRSRIYFTYILHTFYIHSTCYICISAL